MFIAHIGGSLTLRTNDSALADAWVRRGLDVRRIAFGHEYPYGQEGRS